MTMVAAKESPSVTYIPYAYTCLFEKAEHFFECLLSRTNQEDTPIEDIVAFQQESAQTSVDALTRAMELKLVQRQGRLGQILQPELVQAFQHLCVKVKKTPLLHKA